jgi:hypothetical protein
MDPKLIILGLLILFLVLTWGHFKTDFGPQIWALGPEKNKYLRGFVHVLVMPLRLLASVFASGVALLVILLMLGFAYVIWRMMHG